MSDLEYLQQTVIYLIALATCVYILAQHCKKKRKKEKKLTVLVITGQHVGSTAGLEEGQTSPRGLKKSFKKRLETRRSLYKHAVLPDLSGAAGVITEHPF